MNRGGAFKKTGVIGMEYDSSGEENWKKRYREGKEDEKYFGGSKLAKRSPSKSANVNEDMMQMMREVLARNDEMMAELKDMRKEQRATLDYIRELKIKNMELEKGLREATNRIEQLEKDKRKNNIIIKGLTLETDDRNSIKHKLEQFIESNLQLNVKLKEGSKIGEKMFLAEMENMSDKVTVLKNKSKLKNGVGRSIYIESDMTKMEREIQATIRKIAKEEKEKGMTTKIGYMKLIVNGKELKWDKEKGELTERLQNTGRGSSKN